MTNNITYILNQSVNESVVGFVRSTSTELVGGHLFNVLLIVIFIVAVWAAYSKTNDIKPAVTAASFVCFILSVLLTGLKLINDVLLFIFILAFAGSLAWASKGRF